MSEDGGGIEADYDEWVRKLVNWFELLIQVLRGHWQDANRRDGWCGLKQVFL